MKVTVYSSKPYDTTYLQEYNSEHHHDLVFINARLNPLTAELARGSDAICVFVNDSVDAQVLERFVELGVKLVALRSAGFNHVDLEAAARLGVKVVRVPAYSPYAVAEHTVGLILCLNRRLHRAYNRVRDSNFSLDGLLGFDLHGKTVGIVGTGKIGEVVATIMQGFGCRLLAFDVHQNPACQRLGVEYVPFDELLASSDVITLHCPLTPQTHHLINNHSLGKMKAGAMLINTSRGALIDTSAVIRALKTQKLGSLGIDVYEEEGDLFFEDLSGKVLQDDVFSRLLTFPNVLITGHQAFFTHEALLAIAKTTLQNISDIEREGRCENEVRSVPK